MADEFLIFLAAGLLLLAVGLMFVLQPQQLAEQKPEKALVFESNFSASYSSGVQAADAGSRELFSGLFFGGSGIRQHFEAEGIENATVKFSVKSSNYLMPLEIRVNGKLVERRNYAIGDYAIDIGKEFLSDRMDIEIKPMSSLWKIWAPNLYSLKDVRFEARNRAFVKKEFAFQMPDNAYDEARLELALDKNIGSAGIEINGREIFSGFMRSQQSIELKKGELAQGDNRLVISPKADSKFSGIARIVVFSEKQEFQPLPVQQQSRFRSLSIFESDP